jgi:hypothetical protein
MLFEPATVGIRELCKRLVPDDTIASDRSWTKLLGCLNLLWGQIGEKGLPMPWRCERLPTKDEPIGREFDIRATKS